MPQTKKQKRIPGRDQVEEKRGLATCKLYVAAVTDLYSMQVALKINSNPHPRKNKIITDLIKSIASSEHERNKKAFTDRGRDGPNDGVKGKL